MKISAFTMCRNVTKFYYPVKESIMSALPLVDEMVIALGESDEDDETERLIIEINSPKIKVIHTKWDLDAYPNGMVHAQQTDLAKAHCTGDWLLYLQADELIHEKNYELIKSACTDYLDDLKVEGFLFDYFHFWGDYYHVIKGHTWYDQEIRIVRNVPEIHSWQSAQSFRYMPNFNGKDYRMVTGTRKLRVKKIKAAIYHYGWVRPPSLMTNKMQALDRIHSHSKQRFVDEFDYGDLSQLTRFTETHPKAITHWMQGFNWQQHLNYGDRKTSRTYLLRHEKLKYRILSWIELRLLNGNRIGAFKNFTILK
jgi:glycosyltransferase involved in cell wall biosynthesis